MEEDEDEIKMELDENFGGTVCEYRRYCIIFTNEERV